jgi:hypothetical protein
MRFESVSVPGRSDLTMRRALCDFIP